MNQIVPAAVRSEPLTRPQKAAVIIRVLLNEDAAPDLRALGLDPLKNVVRTMATLGDISKPTLVAVIEEFLGDLGNFGLSLRSSLEETVAVLKGHVSEATLSQIEGGVDDQPGIDLWAKLATIGPGPLAEFLAGEHPQVAAVVLSKIPAENAAVVLSGITEEAARDIIVAITRTTGIEDPAVDAIARSINDHFFAIAAPKAFDTGPAERIGGIMNHTQSKARERLLDMFEAEDPETATQVRRVMFTFADIPARVAAKDVAKIVRVVEQDVLVRALHGAQSECPDSKTFILDNLTNRLAQQITDEIEEMGDIKQRDIDAAMNTTIAAIRALAEAGEMELQYEQED